MSTQPASRASRRAGKLHQTKRWAVLAAMLALVESNHAALTARGLSKQNCSQWVKLGCRQYDPRLENNSGWNIVNGRGDWLRLAWNEGHCAGFKLPFSEWCTSPGSELHTRSLHYSRRRRWASRPESGESLRRRRWCRGFQRRESL